MTRLSKCFALLALGALLVAPEAFAMRMDSSRSSESCRTCHKEIHQEWFASAHAAAWTNKLFQFWYRKTGRPRECVTCHAPKPIFETGLHAHPQGRDRYLSEGVNCQTCHAQGERVLGPYGLCVTHLSYKSLAFKRDEVCLPCHAAKCARYTYYLSAQSRQTCSHRRSARSKTHTCQDCHMKAKHGKLAQTTIGKAPSRPRHSHEMNATRRPSMLAEAVEVAAEAHEHQIIVSFVNAQSGHFLPGGEQRSLVAELAFLDDVGQTLETRREFFSAYNGNRIRPGETRMKSYRRHGESRGVRITLFWRLFHSQAPCQWTRIDERIFRWEPYECEKKAPCPDLRPKGMKEPVREWSPHHGGHPGCGCP